MPLPSQKSQARGTSRGNPTIIHRTPLKPKAFQGNASLLPTESPPVIPWKRQLWLSGRLPSFHGQLVLPLPEDFPRIKPHLSARSCSLLSPSISSLAHLGDTKPYSSCCFNPWGLLREYSNTRSTRESPSKAARARKAPGSSKSTLTSESPFPGKQQEGIQLQQVEQAAISAVPTPQRLKTSRNCKAHSISALKDTENASNVGNNNCPVSDGLFKPLRLPL